MKKFFTIAVVMLLTMTLFAQTEKKSFNANSKFVKWFSELSKNDIKVAGGKGANLGEMYNNKFIFAKIFRNLKMKKR